MASAESYYRFQTTDGCLIVTLLPELNEKQWADIEKVGSELVDRLGGSQTPRLMVDLTPLSYMGSAMVALIVRLYKTVNGRAGKMVVVNQHELVFEVLKLAGLTKLWTIVDNREKGFAALGVTPRRTSPADGSAPSDSGLLIAGIVGTAGALVGLALQFSQQNLVSRKGALLIEVAFAFIGFVAGTMLLVNKTGMRRNAGIAFLGICLLAVLGGILASDRVTAPAPRHESSTSAPAAAGPTAALVPTSSPAAAPVASASNGASPLAPGKGPAVAADPAANKAVGDKSARRNRKDKGN